MWFKLNISWIFIIVYSWIFLTQHKFVWSKHQGGHPCQVSNFMGVCLFTIFNLSCSSNQYLVYTIYIYMITSHWDIMFFIILRNTYFCDNTIQIYIIIILIWLFFGTAIRCFVRNNFVITYSYLNMILGQVAFVVMKKHCFWMIDYINSNEV